MTRLLAPISLALLLSLLGSLTLAADDTDRWRREDSADRADTTIAYGGGEMSNGEMMLALQRELNRIIRGIKSVEDVEAADPKIGAIFEAMAAAITASAEDPEMAVAQNDPEARKLEEEMTKHIEEITTRNPDVGIALAGVMLKHSHKLLDAATALMEDLETSGELDEARKALEDAATELEKSGELIEEDENQWDDEEEWDEEIEVPDVRPGSPADRLKEAIYTMMEELIEISEEMESIEDVREAHSEISAAIAKVTAVAEEIADDMASLTPEDRAALRSLQDDLQVDPRFQKLSDRATKAQDVLIEHDPEAAEEFEQATQEEGMRMAQTMRLLMDGLSENE